MRDFNSFVLNDNEIDTKISIILFITAQICVFCTP